VSNVCTQHSAEMSTLPKDRRCYEKYKVSGVYLTTWTDNIEFFGLFTLPYLPLCVFISVSPSVYLWCISFFSSFSNTCSGDPTTG